MRCILATSKRSLLSYIVLHAKKNWSAEESRLLHSRTSLPHDLQVVRRIGGQPLFAVLVKTPHIGHLTAMRENRTQRVAVEDLTDNATLTPVRKLLVFLFAFCSSHPAKGRLSEGSAQCFSSSVFVLTTRTGAPVNGKNHSPGASRTDCAEHVNKIEPSL